MVDVDDVATELYGLTPDVFTARRDARAAEAKQAGDSALATTIKGLRRPTAGAWIANTLVRRRATAVDELLALGRDMRTAQEKLAGDRLRTLATRRHELVAALVSAARDIAVDLDRPLGQAVARELETTLEAAVADTGAADALRSGRLTTAMRYSGLGPVDLTGVVTAPGPTRASSARPTGRDRDSGGRSDPRSRPGPDTDRARRQRAAARAEVAAARAAERKVENLRRQRDRCHDLVVGAEVRLRELRRSEAEARTALRKAESASAAARRREEAVQSREARSRPAGKPRGRTR